MAVGGVLAHSVLGTSTGTASMMDRLPAEARKMLPRKLGLLLGLAAEEVDVTRWFEKKALASIRRWYSKYYVSLRAAEPGGVRETSCTLSGCLPQREFMSKSMEGLRAATNNFTVVRCRLGYLVMHIT